MSRAFADKEFRPTIDPAHVRIADCYAGGHCAITIDGRRYPARVSGRLERFATIQPNALPGVGIEFAWPTVERIMARDQHFQA